MANSKDAGMLLLTKEITLSYQTGSIIGFRFLTRPANIYLHWVIEQVPRRTERIEKEKQWAVQREPSKKAVDIQINPQWEKIDTGQLNEPAGVWIDVKAKELWVANGWNCRSERLDYDSNTSSISRKENEAINGIVWGPWVCRNCVGTSEGKYIHLSSPFGILQIFNDRSKLNANSKIDKEITGKAYGNMKNIGDITINSKGQVAVADTGNNRIVIFEKDFEMPQQPFFESISNEGAQITWKTKQACISEIMIRKGDLPDAPRVREILGSNKLKP